MSIRKFAWRVFGSTVAIMAAGVSAQAADLPPLPDPPQLRPAIHSWNGPYAGVHAGGGFLEADYTPTPGPDPELNGGGVLGGGFVGYNMQFGSLVAGIEGDFSFTNIDAQNTLDAVEYEIPWIATARARLGFSADRTLFFVTGGLGIAEGEMTLPAFGEDDSQTHYGYVVGGGMEHALLDAVSLRLDYLYGHFEEKRYNFSSGVVDLPLEDLHMVRAGIAWHLDPHQ
jgi:outer membrane immunogenic protein